MTSPSRNRIVVAGLLGLGLLLRLPGMLESLWFDEIYRTLTFYEQLETTQPVRHLLFHDVHNFLYNLVLQGWIRVFGDTEISIRLPSLALGLSSAYLLCRWAGRHFGAPFGHLLLAWIVTAPFHIWYSTEAKNVIAVSFFSVWILIAYANLIELPRPRTWCLAVLSGVLGICADFLLFFPLASALSWSCARSIAGRSRQPFSSITAAVGSTLLLLCPLLVFKYLNLSEMLRPYTKTFSPEELFLLLFNYLPTGNAIALVQPYQGWASISEPGAKLVLVVLSLGLAALLVLGVVRLGTTQAGMLAVFTFLVPILLMLLFTLQAALRQGDETHSFYLERSLGSVVFYPFAIVLLGGALALRRPVLRRGAFAALIGLNLLATGLLLTVHRDDWTVWFPNPDWRRLAAEVELEQSQTVVVTNGPDWVVDYYLRDSQHFARDMSSVRGAKDIGDAVRTAFADRGLAAPATFYVVVNQFMGRPVDFADLARSYRVLDTRRYRGLVAYRVALPDATEVPR